MARSIFAVPLIIFFTFLVYAQNAPSNTQAQALAVNSLSALTGGLSVRDVTLTGTARRIAGSDNELGSAVLKATSDGSSRLDLNLPSGLRSEVRYLSASGQLVGSWSDPDGKPHSIAQHNLDTDANWFFPAAILSRFASTQDFVFSYIGQETKNGESLLHLQVVRNYSQVSKRSALLRHLSQMEVFLDSSSLLPVTLAFDTHPEDNADLDIPVEVHYSNYQDRNGVKIPFRVDKYLNNGLVLDLQIQSATVNTGVSASDFQLQ